MTTEIIVKAHCGDDKEVRIKITEKGLPVDEITLQDGGQSEANYVYDDREIHVKEVLKGS